MQIANQLVFQQLGANPSSIDGQYLGRGESACLTAGQTLFLVNQSHPFTVEFTDIANSNSHSPKKEKGTVIERSRDTDDIVKTGRSGPKKNIQDYFGKSPQKVYHPRSCIYFYTFDRHIFLKATFYRFVGSKPGP